MTTLREQVFNQIRERHARILFIDWRKEFNPDWQPSSLSNAELCRKDRANLLSLEEWIQHKEFCNKFHVLISAARGRDTDCVCGLDAAFKKIVDGHRDN